MLTRCQDHLNVWAMQGHQVKDVVHTVEVGSAAELSRALHSQGRALKKGILEVKVDKQ